MKIKIIMKKRGKGKKCEKKNYSGRRRNHEELKYSERTVRFYRLLITKNMTSFCIKPKKER